MPKQRPIIKMKQSGSRRRGGGSLEEPAGTETGQNLANLMGSIIKESTTGKRYVEKATEGQDWHGKSEGKPQKPAAGDSTWREWAAERSNGSRGHFDAGHT